MNGKIDGNRQKDANGRIIINMTVNDDADFLSVFSQTETPVISSDVADFLESGVRTVNPKEQLALKIHSNCITDNEKIIYAKAIRTYYKEKKQANDNELKRNNMIALTLLVIGILVLAVSVFMEFWLKNTVLAEVVDIIAWVLIWESADIAIFKNSSMRINSRRYLAFEDIKIEYYDYSKIEN